MNFAKFVEIGKTARLDGTTLKYIAYDKCKEIEERDRRQEEREEKGQEERRREKEF